MGEALELKIITGMSGAGKSQVINVLEDMGFFCIDNLPPNLFGKFAELALREPSDLKKIALVADVRGRSFFAELVEAVERFRRTNIRVEVIFLEASDDVLVRRFKETRRKHPLAATGSVLSGIQLERHLLHSVRGAADVIIDTSNMSSHQLKDQIISMLDDKGKGRLAVSIFSFGFKYGMPIDADLVMDVRFLPNPYYDEKMRTLSGNDAPVRDYVLEKPVSRNFINKFSDLLNDLLPCYVEEGKRHLSS